MARKGEKQHLLKVEREGFACLEEIFRGRYPAPSQPQGPQQLQQQFVMECSEAAKKYGAIVFVHPRERKPVKLQGKGYRYYDVD